MKAKIGSAVSGFLLTAVALCGSPARADALHDQGISITAAIIDTCQIPSDQVVVRPEFGLGLHLERSPTLSPAQIDCMNQVIATAAVPVDGAPPPADKSGR